MAPGNEDGLSAWGPRSAQDTWVNKERLSSFGGGRWNTRVGKHERMTHQIRIATIICPAFCHRQSDLEQEATITDLFLELRLRQLEDSSQELMIYLYQRHCL